MELRQLRYFVAIVEHGSLSRAARGLHIAQPALTQQIHLLEDELGAHLLHRSPRGVLPTEVGRKFYDHALAILKQVADCKSGILAFASHPAGAVAIGIPQSVSGILALPLLKAARARYPDISIQLTEELSGNLTEQLRTGRINLSILFDDGQLGGFATIPMVDEKMLFVTAPNSRFAPPRASLTLARALSAPLILPSIQHGVRPRIEQLARAAGVELANVMEINSVSILKSALMADLGPTIQAAAPLMPELGLHGLRAYEIRGAKVSRRIALCASKEIPQTSAAAAIARLMLDVVAELCRSGGWPHATALEAAPALRQETHA